MALTKDQILGVVDFNYEEIDVPEWGGAVRLRGLSAAERDDFEASIGVTQDLTNMRARLVVNCIIGEDGNRLFKNSDAKLLGEKNAVVVNKLFDKCRELSGMSDQDLGIAEGN